MPSRRCVGREHVDEALRRLARLERIRARLQERLVKLVRV